MEWLFLVLIIVYPNLAVLLGLYFIYQLFIKNHTDPQKNRQNLKMAVLILAGLVAIHLLVTFLFKVVEYLFL